MDPAISAFYLSKPEPAKSCLQSLREIVLKYDQNIKETRKYGMPCYVYVDKPLCYIWTDKKTEHPYLLLVEGRNLDHSALIGGDRSRMKILPVDPQQDIDIACIHEVLQQALALYR